jgi:hypothetical protein
MFNSSWYLLPHVLYHSTPRIFLARVTNPMNFVLYVECVLYTININNNKCSFWYRRLRKGYVSESITMHNFSWRLETGESVWKLDVLEVIRNFCRSSRRNSQLYKTCRIFCQEVLHYQSQPIKMFTTLHKKSIIKKKKNSMAFSPRVNYTERARAACRQS